jgi:hypothetical protein
MYAVSRAAGLQFKGLYNSIMTAALMVAWWSPVLTGSGSPPFGIDCGSLTPRMETVLAVRCLAAGAARHISNEDLHVHARPCTAMSVADG